LFDSLVLGKVQYFVDKIKWSGAEDRSAKKGITLFKLIKVPLKDLDRDLKPVFSHKDYLISKNGDVFSINKKWSLNGFAVKMRPQEDKDGYLSILFNSHFKKKYQIHSLICRAYNGNPPLKRHVVNHKNGNKKDNFPSNLEWVLPEDNERYSWNFLNKNKKMKRDKYGRFK